jgi:CheY-like chemotaxis protein
LTQQLLIFSRNQTLNSVVLDLNEAISGMDKMLSQLTGENIELSIALERPLGHIKADSGYIGQLLMNLVVNARDAMPEGGRLTVTTANVSLVPGDAQLHPNVPTGEYVVLSVHDTGMGMSEEVKNHLFEAFFTTKPTGKGTGLGLATCQTIAKQLGAHIEVESAPNKGTTFRVFFPQIDQPVENDAFLMKSSGFQRIRGSETVLVVEDETALRRVVVIALRAQGYTVLQASCGQEGLRVANEHRGSPIDLVITDIVMPQMGGKVMVEWLKATYPKLKILFTSGYTNETAAYKDQSSVGAAFLPKPYNLGALTRKIREVLNAA